ncbi:MAG: ROK family protein [Planctomycetes bacterium]|nr:ROK family protein [Planctomycetota bacterium]
MPPSSAARLVVGIDLGGTNMQIGVVDAANKITGRTKKKTKADEGQNAVIDRLVSGIEEACEEAHVKVSDLDAVGIGAPGGIDHKRGIVMEAPNLRWNDVPLAKILSDRLKGRPVVVDNDVNVAVYGENKLGAGNGAEDVLGVWVGTGVGGGLVLNGRLYQGGFGTAGEIGHTVLFPGAALGNRKLEENCSRKFIALRLARLIRANNPSMLTEIAGGDDKIESVGAGALGEAYRKGDELVRTVVDESADLMGIAIAHSVTVLALPLVILGGGLTEALGDPYVKRVQASARANAFPRRCKDVKVVATKLEDDAGLLGAALLAREAVG